MGIVTGRPRADSRRFLETAGVSDLFRVVVTREDAPLKPDPAPVRLALERLGVRRAWLVGDTPDDLRAARAAGVVPLAALDFESKAGGVEHRDGLRDALLRAGAARILATAAELEELP
jgi:phosphoglycolate phosphatase-like HAD superfamily hydrolase